MANPTRGKHWIQTASGRQFWPLDPRPEDLDLGDIAHALSNLCRFGGHCREFYSVAQHSIHVSCEVQPRALKAAGLMHDATEAYLIDLPRPIKDALPEYRVAEDRLWRVIAKRYGLPEVLPEEVKEADERMLATEQRDLMAAPPREWEFGHEPYDWNVRGHNNRAYTARVFLRMARELGIE